MYFLQNSTLLQRHNFANARKAFGIIPGNNFLDTASALAAFAVTSQRLRIVVLSERFLLETVICSVCVQIFVKNTVFASN
jgi:hypothetical protein